MICLSRKKKYINSKIILKKLILYIYFLFYQPNTLQSLMFWNINQIQTMHYLTKNRNSFRKWYFFFNFLPTSIVCITGKVKSEGI
jgi:hypothetical protein